VTSHLRVADEDDGARRGVHSLVVELEGRPAGKDDVDLFVPERLLRVLLDDVVPDSGRDVGVDSERADIERPPNGPPEELSPDDRNRLDLVQPNALPAFRHPATLQNGRRPLEAAFGKSSGVAIAWEVCLHGAPFSIERAHRAHCLHRTTGI
jgi:hypothetical protein